VSEDITLRLEPPVLDALAKQAEAHGRSPEQEAAEIVRRNVRVAPDRAELIAAFARLRAMTPRAVQQTDSVQLIREDRDR